MHPFSYCCFTGLRTETLPDRREKQNKAKVNDMTSLLKETWHASDRFEPHLAKPLFVCLFVNVFFSSHSVTAIIASYSEK